MKSSFIQLHLAVEKLYQKLNKSKPNKRHQSFRAIEKIIKKSGWTINDYWIYVTKNSLTFKKENK